MRKSYLIQVTFVIILSSCVSESKRKIDNNTNNTIHSNMNKITHSNENRVNFLTGKFNPEDHEEFVIVDNQYHTKSNMYLHKETLNAFVIMHNAAKSEGINLLIVSGTRNFESQKKIWERKYNLYKKQFKSDIGIIKEIMTWSSMPGTSRHHWGTDIDINGFDDYFHDNNHKANQEYQWLVENAFKFGFCQVYSKKGNGGRVNGYNEEKWHWSYMPLSSKYLSEYKNLVSYKNINNFSASEHARELNIIEHYVLGISSNCKVQESIEQ